jgi:hypothetical protein
MVPAADALAWGPLAALARNRLAKRMVEVLELLARRGVPPTGVEVFTPTRVFAEWAHLRLVPLSQPRWLLARCS